MHQDRGGPAPHPPSGRAPHPSRRHALPLAALAIILLAWFLWPFVGRGAAFPVGPDGPVYLWWTRLAGLEGLSAVGSRPGVPALALVVGGTLGLSVVQVTAALEVALGVAVGLASAALVRGSGRGWTLAGLLAGTFAVHLAAGYLANLATAAAFLAAATLLDRPGGTPAALAALVLAGGGLAHPLFLLVGAVVLLVAAATALTGARDEALRLAGAAVAAGACVGAGLLAVLPGADALEVDTSKDAFLRRAGLGPELERAYLDRFAHRWTRYVQWISVPLGVAGLPRAEGIAGRILRSWLLVTAVGVAVALATGWLPADRFVTFGFAVPILAALGVVGVWERLRHRRVVAFGLAGAVVIAMLAGAGVAWNRQEPFVSDDEVRAATLANGVIIRLDEGTPLAFLVNERDATVTFLATRAGNVIRASVPPERIRDVVVVVPPLEGEEASGERRALERLSARDLAEAETRAGRSAAIFVLTPFDDVDRPADAVVVVAPALPTDAFPDGSLEPSSPAGIAWASIGTLGLLGLVGYGWARIALADRIAAAAAAPALGAAVLIVTAVVLDAVGVAIGQAPAALAASALAGPGGYLLRLVLERRARARAAPQVEQ